MPQRRLPAPRRRTAVRIRVATLGDLPVLVHQRRQMFMSMGERDQALLERADRAYASWFREQARKGRIHALVAELRGGQVVAGGTVWLQERQPRPGFDGGPMPYLMSMYTEPEHRGQGIASAVLERTIAWCLEQGFGSMSLHASPDGRHLYQRRGFLRTQEFRLRLLPMPARGSRSTKATSSLRSSR
jgi:GNAT superfamily N-acetyltransferase